MKPEPEPVVSMRSALYYPHTKIQSEALSKTALLLWDELHTIAPWPEYNPNYPPNTQNEAFELIGRCHYPSGKEKQQAHKLVEDFVSRQLPKRAPARPMHGHGRLWGRPI